MAFKKDLRTGQSAEDFIIEILTSAGISTKSNQDRDKFSDFDLEGVLNGRPFTIEAKFDLYECRSGNIAIEFFNPKQNRPTGIDLTKADLWVHVLDKPKSAWVTTVPALRRYIRTHKPVRVIDRGGDDNASILLYRRETIFADIFHPLDGNSKQLLSELLGPKYKAAA